MKKTLLGALIAAVGLSSCGGTQFAIATGDESLSALTQVTDNDAILTFVKEVVQENPKAVEDFKNGKTNVVGWLMGQVMKKSGGKANPKTATELLKQILSEV